MLRLRWMVVGVALGILSTAAAAFQETKGGVAGEQQAPKADVVAPGVPQLDLKDTGVSVAAPSGVEVRIPGLGKLGVLPKFDFGLELLYGANDHKPGDSDAQTPATNSDDVQIRGSFRHRF
jgi:hypothetical protein